MSGIMKNTKKIQSMTHSKSLIKPVMQPWSLIKSSKVSKPYYRHGGSDSLLTRIKGFRVADVERKTLDYRSNQEFLQTYHGTLQGMVPGITGRPANKDEIEAYFGRPFGTDKRSINTMAVYERHYKKMVEAEAKAWAKEDIVGTNTLIETLL